MGNYRGFQFSQKNYRFNENSYVSFPYPPSPVNIPSSVTEVSPAFKKEVVRTTTSIIVFLVVYVVLFLISLLLLAGSVYGGLFILSNLRGLWGILLGIGIIGVAVMVFVFLVKFLFSVNKYDRTGIVEVREEEQPELFAFIRQLTAETNTPFPKHIYLSPDVNACVFYDSSFLSMIFPVKKNLQIGLGLVNTLNLSEFKAVMAHEFGHFSQSSMKLGSFVYNVNRVIYNMLYQNNSYGNFLQGWARIADTFALFAGITFRIVQAIQWVLQQVYGLVNKSYMSLSREMEFHADAVAASVSGSRSLVTALKRVDFAGAGYGLVIDKYSELVKQKTFCKNFYTDHFFVMQQLAVDNRIPLVNGLPVIQGNEDESRKFQRVNYKDQWASHPTTEEREAHLEKLQVKAEEDKRSAWILFRDTENLQARFTENIYSEIPREEGARQLESDAFAQLYRTEREQFTLPEAYLGFYDGRHYSRFDIAPLIQSSVNAIPEAAAIFNASNGQIQKAINGIRTDLEILKAIHNGSIDTKTFDFEGVKYQKHESPEIQRRLMKEQENLEARQLELDQQALLFFYHKANDTQKIQLRNSYQQWMDERKRADKTLEGMNKMLEGLNPVFTGETISIEIVEPMIARLKNQDEPVFKSDLKYWLEQGVFQPVPELETIVNKFLESNYYYFSENSFFENELNELDRLCRDSWDAINTHLFKQFKKILEEQLPLLH